MAAILDRDYILYMSPAGTDGSREFARPESIRGSSRPGVFPTRRDRGAWSLVRIHRSNVRVYEIEVGIEVPRGKGSRQVLTGLNYCDERDVRLFVNNFNGKSCTRKWRPVRLYIDKPLLPRPDFFIFGGGWVCNERAMLVAGEAMEMAGEYLPVEIEKEKGEFAFFHITNCINVLDPDESQWEQVGPYKQLKKLAFRAERFGEETLFKIPEDFGTRCYCLDRNGEADDGEFKAVVERHKLTGLRFDLVWSDAEGAD